MLSVSRPSEPVVFSGCVTRYQADLAPLENLHQPREIQQRPAEPIHLIYQYAVDAIRLDVSEQFAECGPFQVRAGVSSIVIVFGKCRPSRMNLTLNISLGRFPLCFEGIELLGESFFG
jgi:hypothetical protein